MSPEDILIRITVDNRGAGEAALDVLPTLWFRNTWSWDGRGEARRCVPRMRCRDRGRTMPNLGSYVPGLRGCRRLLFTENETNTHRLFGAPNAAPTSRTESTISWWTA